MKRLMAWAVMLGVVVGAYVLLTRRLALQDPIAEMLLGRAGSVVPLLGVVLLLRVALFVVLPGVVAIAVARIALDEIARRKER